MSTAAAIGYDAAMRLAVERADMVKGSTYPNPPVGAVILDRDGRVAGAGLRKPLVLKHCGRVGRGHDDARRQYGWGLSG